ncbi:MAG: hypothetical protein AAB935_01255, partial [Patescibacteria group bacterium]
KRKKGETQMKKTLAVLVSVVALGFFTGCDDNQSRTPSKITKQNVEVPVDPSGLTSEQKNVKERLLEDNKPGSVKHLYVISAYSGQVIIYSTVRGKVTSSGKRLIPYSTAGNGFYNDVYTWTDRNGNNVLTTEVLQDDGTYGSSSEYLYWWDTKGVYHQHYVSGGQIVHVSNQPLAVKGIIINMEITQKSEGEK